jgi:hypothetical protein
VKTILSVVLSMCLLQSAPQEHVGAMTGAMVATAIVFFPAPPLFLFMKGKDTTIPQGTDITAYTSGDIPLDTSKFAVDPTLAASAAPAPVVSASASALSANRH